MEVTKMKMFHYLRKIKVSTLGAKQKVKVFVCGLCSREAKVAELMKQLYQDTRDFKNLCALQIMTWDRSQMNSPKEFKAKIQSILKKNSASIEQSIFFFDELFPNFAIDNFKNLASMKGVDFVLSIRHSFNGNLFAWKIMNYFRSPEDSQTIMSNAGVQEPGYFGHFTFCQLRQSYRCTHELIDFMYHWLIHSHKEDDLFKEKSFIHSTGAFKGPKPLWLEVESVEVFIQHVEADDQLNTTKDVLVMYDLDLFSKEPLGKYCKTKNWKFCPVNEIMGSEAKIVIIYDAKEIHFEALSRAINQLIIVTTPKSEG